MRKLLRKTSSKEWLAADGQLTLDVDQAVIVRDVAHALHLCRKHQLKGMEMVLKFDSDEYDVVLKIGDAWVNPERNP